MISFIGNRPAIQIGTHQVLDYDTAWLKEAILRAARAADIGDFPLVEEVKNGVELYLEHKCALRLLNLEDLFERIRKMLIEIGCQHIAEKLEPLAPTVTISLTRAANAAGNGFELAFFETLRAELSELHRAGAESIHFTGLRESALILSGREKWDKHSDRMLSEIKEFIQACDRDARVDSRSLRLSVEA
ncbi:MAG: hypothetical protein ABJQ29_11885 [Luteolibacter sp.]